MFYIIAVHFLQHVVLKEVNKNFLVIFILSHLASLIEDIGDVVLIVCQVDIYQTLIVVLILPKSLSILFCLV